MPRFVSFVLFTRRPWNTKFGSEVHWLSASFYPRRFCRQNHRKVRGLCPDSETSLSLCVVEARARVGCVGCVNSEPPSLFWAYCGFTMHISTWKNLEALFCQYHLITRLKPEDQYHEQIDVRSKISQDDMPARPVEQWQSYPFVRSTLDRWRNWRVQTSIHKF